MRIALAPFDFAARQGRILLIGGLVVAIAFPNLALLIKEYLPELIALLLFTAALRIGPRQAIGAARDMRASAIYVLVLQLALPVSAIILFKSIGFYGPLVSVIVLMLAASPVAGAPNLAILCEGDPAPALRLVIAGTALLPLTVLPVFWLAPEFGTGFAVIEAAGRLMAIITIAAAFAFLLRVVFMKNIGPAGLRAIDGASAIQMAIVVMGLMSAVGPALRYDPAALAFNLVAAFAANFGLQIAAALLLQKTDWHDKTIPFAICAGNRNIALFLTSLPAVVTDPLLLFIGCYQIPMYMTPLLLSRFYSRRGGRGFG